MEAEMELKAIMESGRVQKWWSIAWALCAAYVAFQTIQQHYGLGLTKTLPMELRKISKPQDGPAYEWRLPHRYRNPLMTHRAVLLEDGWPMQRAERVKELYESGPGWFNIFRDLTRFIPVDGSDPRTNGRRYEMVVPVQYEGREIWVPWLILLVLSLGVRARPTAWTWPLSPAQTTALVFVAALIIGGVRIWHAGLYSDGAFTVGGQPESDAAAWYLHAQGLAEGWGITTGFSGQRPMYGVLLAPLFWLPGDPMFWIRGLNLLLWASAAAGVFMLGRLLQGPLLGVVCALATLLGQTHLPHVMAVLTENTGLALGAAAALSMWAGVRKRSAWLIVVAGLLSGFCNLSSGATMLALPALAFWFVLMGRQEASWRLGVQWAVVFTIAVSAVLLPWMIRQKVVMGTFSPSLNSGTLLRGGADPEHKRMWPGMHNEPFEKEGIPRNDEGGMYDYHMKIYRQLVAEDPVRYVSQVAAAWWETSSFFRIGDPGVRLAVIVLLLALALMGIWNQGRWSGLVVAVVLGLGFLELDRPLAVWVLWGSLAVSMIAHWRKKTFGLAVLLVIHLVGGTLLSAMAGNHTATRLWQVLDWTALLLMLGALQVIWSWCTKCLWQSQKEPEHADAAALGGVWSGVCVASVLFCLVMLALGPRAPQAVSVTDEVKQAVLDKVKAEHPNAAIRERSDLTADVLRLGHRVYFQPAGYDTAHWRSHYRRRAVDRWVLNPERADVERSPYQRSFIPAQVRGDLGGVSRAVPVLWVSVKSEQISGIGGESYDTSEGAALVPLSSGQPQWEKLVWLEPVDVKLP